jgi:phosphate transport system substrate-binding protein
MRSLFTFALLPLLAAGALAPSIASARDQIRIVGSSTVYPFATVVAEEFGRGSSFKTPIIESTGTGGGLKLFCAGVGVDHPDITNASRRIKASEVELCGGNGVEKITEIRIGYDGIVMANSKASPRTNLTLRQIFLALAKEIPAPSGDLIPNPNKTWKDVDPSLPATRIEVLGPPPTSGTRDAFNELAIEGGCKTFPDLAALKKTDKNLYKKVCRSVREDGAYVEAGENDNLIVQKLVSNPNAFGVFGFSFLDQNADRIQGSTVGGVEPTFDDISSGDYPVSRSLFFYVKNAHAQSIPGIREYITEFTSEAATGDEGYLADRGLIPAPEEIRKKVRADAASLRALELASGH